MTAVEPIETSALVVSGPDDVQIVHGASPDDDSPKGRFITRNWKAMGWGTRLAFIWISIMIFAAISSAFMSIFGFKGAPSLKLFDPNELPFLVGSDTEGNEGPSTLHWLGTDNLGRDNFSRIWHGAQVSLTVAATGVLFGMTFGLFLGSLAGFLRGRVETVIMAVVDVILAFPALILLLIMSLVIGRQTLPYISLTFGVLAIAPFTRVSRANALSVSNREFVMAARSIGTKPLKILTKEVIPNVAPSVFGYALVYAALVIAIEGSLGFLGLSVQPPKATWGSMLNEARKDIKVASWPIIWPALAFFFTILSLNLLGDFYRKRTAVKAAAL